MTAPCLLTPRRNAGRNPGRNPARNPAADAAATLAALRATLAVAVELDAPAGTVYLLHFDRPYKHARHYLGWTTDLAARLAAHLAGAGARLVEVVTAAGITFSVARVWPGTRRSWERQLKGWGGAARVCPRCNPAGAMRRARIPGVHR